MDFHGIGGLEQGPIRPPSEARSLLLRVSRNCPWNKCEFCHTYRGTKFSLRPVEEVLAEIDMIRDIAESLEQLSKDMGKGGTIDEDVVRYAAHQEMGDMTVLTVASWLYHGAESIFLQDANSLVVQAEKLEKIVKALSSAFPLVKRITSYARSHTLTRIKQESLNRLREAGLSRIHVGMESGSDDLLKWMKKGTTAEQHINGGLKVKKAGMELSEYIILGLGGTKYSHEHAVESARVLNSIDPHFIRFRTLAIPRSTPLYNHWQDGSFERLDDESIVREERLLLEKLDGICSKVASDHITNLLEKVEGQLPADHDKILAVIDSYLARSVSERQLFQACRRIGQCRSPEHLTYAGVRARAQQVIDAFEKSDKESLDEFLWDLTARYI